MTQSEIEQTIERGEWKSKLIKASDPNGAGGVGIRECREVWERDDADGFVRVALEVLLAEQKRIIGCDVCRGVKILHGTFSGTIPVDGDTQIEVDSDGDVDFDYCPVCGRNMTEATGNKTKRPIG